MDKYLEFIAQVEQGKFSFRTQADQAILGSGYPEGRAVIEKTQGGQEIERFISLNKLSYSEREYLRMLGEKNYISQASGDIRVSVKTAADSIKMQQSWAKEILNNKALTTVNGIPKNDFVQKQESKNSNVMSFSPPSNQQTFLEAVSSAVIKVGGDQVEIAALHAQQSRDLKEEAALAGMRLEAKKNALGWRMILPTVRISLYLENRAYLQLHNECLRKSYKVSTETASVIKSLTSGENIVKIHSLVARGIDRGLVEPSVVINNKMKFKEIVADVTNGIISDQLQQRRRGIRR